MVIKKDPRRVFEMLSRPVEIEDDDFLDTLDPNVSILEDSMKRTFFFSFFCNFFLGGRERRFGRGRWME